MESRRLIPSVFVHFFLLNQRKLQYKKIRGWGRYLRNHSTKYRRRVPPQQSSDDGYFRLWEHRVEECAKGSFTPWIGHFIWVDEHGVFDIIFEKEFGSQFEPEEFDAFHMNVSEKEGLGVSGVLTWFEIESPERFYFVWCIERLEPKRLKRG